MSWDASFDGYDWNYTHNTNRMIRDIEPDWWDSLDGMSGPDGAKLLARIIAGLEADPDKYRAMNPDNGWGDYDGLLSVLHDMAAAGARACCHARKWSVFG